MRPGSSRRKPGGRPPEVPPRMGAPLATLGDLVASVPRRPATRRCRPVGWPRPDNGPTQPASHALHCLRLPGRRNIRSVADLEAARFTVATAPKGSICVLERLFAAIEHL